MSIPREDATHFNNSLYRIYHTVISSFRASDTRVSSSGKRSREEAEDGNHGKDSLIQGQTHLQRLSSQACSVHLADLAATEPLSQLKSNQAKTVFLNFRNYNSTILQLFTGEYRNASLQCIHHLSTLLSLTAPPSLITASASPVPVHSIQASLGPLFSALRSALTRQYPPDSSEPFLSWLALALGLAWLASQQYLNADTILGILVEAQPSNIPARFAWALCCYATGQLPKAIRLGDQSLSAEVTTDPDNARLLLKWMPYHRHASALCGIGMNDTISACALPLPITGD